MSHENDPDEDWEAGHAAERAAMVRDQLVARDIDDERVLGAIRSVPRHLFVPPDLRHLAHDDRPLSIGRGQTISQPYIVALLAQLTLGASRLRALDVGTGCGYQAAVLAALYDQVHSLEIIPELASEADERLRALGYGNVRVRCADARAGWPGSAPYDAIVVACAATRIPEALVEQLAPRGKLAMPVGSWNQELRVVEKLDDGSTRESSAGGVAFVRMIEAAPR